MRQRLLLLLLLPFLSAVGREFARLAPRSLRSAFLRLFYSVSGSLGHISLVTVFMEVATGVYY